MHIHILGVCGTFMGGVAMLAKEQGHHVSGSDQNIYPPMSDALKNAGIEIKFGYASENITPDTDLVIIGNVMSRENPCIEFILNKKINFISGPQWVYENILKSQHIFAVSGTHGKTTTTSLLAWILETAGLKPGFLIGGMPNNFNITSRVGAGKYFVIEADEYDTAFYDKRSKFLHYFPNTLIMNNLEFDHADIFSDLEAIQKQFQYLLRCVPENGVVIFPAECAALQDVVSRGCWSKKIAIGDDQTWKAILQKKDGSQFEILYCNQTVANIKWDLIGKHNIQNALAAIAAAYEAGVSSTHIEKAFLTFQGVKRRLEIRGKINDVTIYDDFAHHPTAIATTIDGLRQKIGPQRIIVIAQLGSNSMKLGAHVEHLADSFNQADQIHILKPEKANWDIAAALQSLDRKVFLYRSVDEMIENISIIAKKQDHVLIMSNQGFGGIHEKLLKKIAEKI